MPPDQLWLTANLVENPVQFAAKNTSKDKFSAFQMYKLRLSLFFCV